MTKFKSLLYREFRLCKKSYILKSILLLGFTGIVLVMLLALGKNGLDPKLISILSSMSCAMMLLFPPMLFAQDECFNPDLASGWLRYSYVLPISPAERNKVRIARFAIAAVISTMYGALCALVICSIFGLSFKVGYVVIAAAANDYVLLFRLLDDVFMLRARNSDEAKKFKMYAAIAELVVIAASALIIMKACNIDVSSLFNSNSNVEVDLNEAFILPDDPIEKIGAVHLLWSVPMMLVLAFADYFVGCINLQRASSAGKLFKAHVKSETKPDLTAPHIDINGFLYKEFAQNRKIIAIILASPFCMAAVAALILFVVSFNKDFGGIDISAIDNWFAKAFTSSYCRSAIMALSYFVVSAYMLYVFSNDDKKLWTYFIATTSDGIRKFVYTKYVVYFAMNGMFFLACNVIDYALCTLGWFAVGEEAVSATNVAFLLFIFSIFTESFRIPIIIRYGNKKGESIMTIVLITLGIIIAAIFLLLPESAMNAFLEWGAKLITGKKIGDISTLIMSASPFISMTAFFISYKISGKLFLKGANEYVK